MGRIAGKTLSFVYHNVTGNGKRDGLKNIKIGQSAAEPLNCGRFNDYPKGVEASASKHPNNLTCNLLRLQS
jgi:hypothetical protein